MAEKKDIQPNGWHNMHFSCSFIILPTCQNLFTVAFDHLTSKFYNYIVYCNGLVYSLSLKLAWLKKSKVTAWNKQSNYNQFRVVNETYDAETRPRRQSLETETLEWRYRDETETSVPPVRDETEMRRSKQRLETFGRDVRAVITTSTV